MNPRPRSEHPVALVDVPLNRLGGEHACEEDGQLLRNPVQLPLNARRLGPRLQPDAGHGVRGYCPDWDRPLQGPSPPNWATALCMARE